MVLWLSDESSPKPTNPRAVYLNAHLWRRKQLVDPHVGERGETVGRHENPLSRVALGVLNLSLKRAISSLRERLLCPALRIDHAVKVLADFVNRGAHVSLSTLTEPGAGADGQEPPLSFSVLWLLAVRWMGRKRHPMGDVCDLSDNESR
jgi:hypothetical protein